MFTTLNPKSRTRLVACLVLLSAVLAGCATTIRPDTHSRYPEHARYDYYYYPTLDIYLETTSGHYWHRNDDRWVRVKHLPPRIHPRNHGRVFLRLDSDRPHYYHKQHRNRYRPRRPALDGVRDDSRERM